MTKGITMPPGTLRAEGVTEECIEHGETLTITFTDAGFFGSVPTNVFAPNLPIGFFPAGAQIEAIAPNNDKDVALCFFDCAAHFGLYLVGLQIRATCPKKRARNKEKK